ncbi:hypothetical protein E2320_005742, partial [Naja naja]
MNTDDALISLPGQRGQPGQQHPTVLQRAAGGPRVVLANFGAVRGGRLGSPVHEVNLDVGLHLRPFESPADICNPIQTTISNAFGLEFLFSFLLHLTLLQFQAMSPTMKVHLVALLITLSSGGHLTGAVFNPALAFSLHGSCFIDQFWNYLVVYCIAPCA